VSSVLYQYAVAGSGAWATACTGATTPFSCTLSSGLPDGTYDFRAIASDGASHTGTSATIASRVVDNFNATDVQIANATGTAGRPDTGDTVTLTTNKAFAPASILAGWTGTSQAITVRITTATPDTLTFYNSANTTQLPLGTVSLGATTYITASGRFSATMVQSGSTIVVTLGTLAAGTVATVTGNNTSTWTPTATPTDVAGTPILTTTATQSGGAKKLF
jgi:hypothetical protein